jgi:putative membrane protein
MRSAFRMVLLSLSGLGSAVPAWAQDGGWDGWWSMCGNWGMWGIGMMVGMLAFWGLVIAGVVVGIRWLVTQGTSRGGAAPSDGALEILRNRYARGEINKEEFDAKTRDLA